MADGTWQNIPPIDDDLLKNIKSAHSINDKMGSQVPCKTYNMKDTPPNKPPCHLQSTDVTNTDLSPLVATEANLTEANLINNQPTDTATVDTILCNTASRGIGNHICTPEYPHHKGEPHQDTPTEKNTAITENTADPPTYVDQELTAYITTHQMPIDSNGDGFDDASFEAGYAAGAGSLLREDLNGDNHLNILDIILLLNKIQAQTVQNEPTPPHTSADMNGDMKINVLDLVIFGQTILNKNKPFNPDTDMNGDMKTDVLDLIILSNTIMEDDIFN